LSKEDTGEFFKENKSKNTQLFNEENNSRKKPFLVPASADN